MDKIIRFFTKDKAFLFAFIFALISMLFIHPSLTYLSYINTNVLIIMFSLMIAVAGLYDDNLFAFVATIMVRKLKNTRIIAISILFATYILGMLITNDAVLLTLIPFTLVVTLKTNTKKDALNIILLQTIAANMGSSLTPMGDPQNIYLYAKYGIGFMEFIKMMLPITLLGLALVMITAYILIPKADTSVDLEIPSLDVKPMMIHLLILFFVLLVILKLIPDYVLLILTSITALIFCRHLFKRVDYHLLLTFVSFFIITGNVSRMSQVEQLVNQFLNSSLSIYITSIVTSQFISNVPASVLLSTFVKPEYVKPLLQGVNVGSMGTLIASLASLISLKFIIKEFPNSKKEYLVKYSIISIIFIIVISIFIHI